MNTAAVSADLAPVITAIRGRDAAIRALGVTALYIYGSRARGDHRPDSDLDVMVEHRPDTLSLLELISIKHMIEDDTGLDVHIATKNSYPIAKHHRFASDLVRVL